MDQVITQAPRRRTWPAEGVTRIPAWVYTDEELYRRELAEFFGGDTWSFVGLECELPKPGTFKLAWIGDKQVIVVRDDDGINVMENRCIHRGSAICWKNKGEAKDLTCPYHQWNYSLKGQLQGVPLRRGANGEGGMPKDFDPRKMSLRRLRVAVRGGSIWASFSDTVPDFAEYCGPELISRIDRLFNGKPLRLVGHCSQLIPSNWKLYFENSRDPYHATLLHTFFITFGLFRADTGVRRTEPTQGGKHTANFVGSAGKKVTGETAQLQRFDHDLQLQDMETVEHRDEFGDRQNSALQVFPSVFLQQHANSLAMRTIIPRGVDKTELSWTFYGYAQDDEQMQRLRLKQSSLVGPAGFVSMEDGEVLKQTQTIAAGYPDAESFVEMGGRDVMPQNTMATEVGLRAFYSFYRNAMGL